MSGHKYVGSADLFEDDEVSDDAFLKSKIPKIESPTNPTKNSPPEHDVQLQKDAATEAYKSKILESAKRSMSLLQQSEDIGIETAAELARQREQLEGTHKQLNDIANTLRYSEKHLNGLKSMFGGLKNYLSGQRQPTFGSGNSSPSRGNSTPEGPSGLSTPRQMGSSGGGFFSPNRASSTGCDMSPDRLSSNDGMYSPPVRVTSPSSDYDMHPMARLRGDYDDAQQNTSIAFNKQLDMNLDEMAGSLSRLKGLAIEMNEDIGTQNELIDTITNQVEDVDLKIGKQNKTMNKLLGKKN